ncbi:uncharacterized protein LOC111175289 [Delphinapterus leucas]|uniref:Uncharacterized protein LOC111175289 n=1 Tax=Delphinapterus leucas TaxID=9749 RepID=A0A7F8K6E0_DELLE|nr:uncharacterized protein LOC111175289 [Delphinapterus leucas]
MGRWQQTQTARDQKTRRGLLPPLCASHCTLGKARASQSLPASHRPADGSSLGHSSDGEMLGARTTIAVKVSDASAPAFSVSALLGPSGYPGGPGGHQSYRDLHHRSTLRSTAEDRRQKELGQGRVKTGTTLGRSARGRACPREHRGLQLEVAMEMGGCRPSGWHAWRGGCAGERGQDKRADCWQKTLTSKLYKTPSTPSGLVSFWNCNLYDPAIWNCHHSQTNQIGLYLHD